MLPPSRPRSPPASTGKASAPSRSTGAIFIMPPLSANSNALAQPLPDPAPVTIAVCPINLAMSRPRLCRAHQALRSAARSAHSQNRARQPNSCASRSDRQRRAVSTRICRSIVAASPSLLQPANEAGMQRGQFMCPIVAPAIPRRSRCYKGECFGFCRLDQQCHGCCGIRRIDPVPDARTLENRLAASPLA